MASGPSAAAAPAAPAARAAWEGPPLATAATDARPAASAAAAAGGGPSAAASSPSSSPSASRWATEVAPRLGAAGFTVATVTIDRTAWMVVGTSAGRLPDLGRADRLRIYRQTVGKQTVLTFGQYFLTREIKLGLDTVQPAPALSTMVACGLTGVPFSSLQYNWAIQDTYRYFGAPPPASPGFAGFLKQKVAPGVAWSFLRASFGTGGGLYFGPHAGARADAALRSCGLEPPATASKVLGGLFSGAAMALATQWIHNVALVGGRMAAVGETAQSPHYTGVALRTAWREMGPSMLYLNFPSRMVIQAVTVCILNACDIFHAPEISGWA